MSNGKKSLRRKRRNGGPSAETEVLSVPRNRLSTPFAGGVPNILPASLHLNALYAPAQLLPAGPTAYTRWTPNDLYDPLYDAGGGQAMFRDQMYTLYHWGRVKSWRFSVEIFSTSVYPVFVALVPKQDATALTYAQAVEQPGAMRGAVNVYRPLKLSLSSTVDGFLGNAPGTWLRDDMFKQPSGSALDVKASTNVHLYMYYPMSAGTADLVVSYNIDQDAVFSELVAQAVS